MICDIYAPITQSIVQKSTEEINAKNVGVIGGIYTDDAKQREQYYKQMFSITEWDRIKSGIFLDKFLTKNCKTCKGLNIIYQAKAILSRWHGVYSERDFLALDKMDKALKQLLELEWNLENISIYRQSLAKLQEAVLQYNTMIDREKFQKRCNEFFEQEDVRKLQSFADIISDEYKKCKQKLNEDPLDEMFDQYSSMLLCGLLNFQSLSCIKDRFLLERARNGFRDKFREILAHKKNYYVLSIL